jgi:hypothetical protein
VSASEEIERGRLAADVLENPVFRDAHQQIRAEIVSRWQVEKDESVREWLWSLMQASKRLESVLIESMQTGQMRQQQIDMQQSRLQKAGASLKRAFTS